MTPGDKELFDATEFNLDVRWKHRVFFETLRMVPPAALMSSEAAHPRTKNLPGWCGFGEMRAIHSSQIAWHTQKAQPRTRNRHERTESRCLPPWAF